MSIYEVSQAVINLGNDYKAKTNDYKAKQEKWFNLVKSEMLGSEQCQIQLKELSDQYNTELSKAADKLKAQVVTAINAENNKEEQLNESMTMDILSELQALQMIDVTMNDINDYKEKYNHNPLAIRILQKIASKNNLTFINTDEKGNLLKDIENQLNVAISRCKKINEDTLSLILIDGMNDHIKETVNKYIS